MLQCVPHDQPMATRAGLAGRHVRLRPVLDHLYCKVLQDNLQQAPSSGHLHPECCWHGGIMGHLWHLRVTHDESSGLASFVAV
jgi:hypothetical protein